VRIILLGAPGSGKGTQAKRMADRFGVPHISTGDILRAAVREGTELGNKAAPIMASGGLVPDDLMIGIIRERMQGADIAAGFILDGFPRTVEQAEKLDAILAGNGGEPARVVALLVPDDVIIRRLGGRRSCPECGAVYHVESTPPKKEGMCDRCGAGLVERRDDKEEAIRARLEAYSAQTMPVAGHYANKGALYEIDGLGSVDEIFERIETALTR